MKKIGSKPGAKRRKTHLHPLRIWDKYSEMMNDENLCCARDPIGIPFILFTIVLLLLLFLLNIGV
jgi:hypothetical protein